MADKDDDGTSVEGGAVAANQGGRIGKPKPTQDEGSLGSVIGGRAPGGIASGPTTGDWGGGAREPSGRGVGRKPQGRDPVVGERGEGEDVELRAFTDDDKPPVE